MPVDLPAPVRAAVDAANAGDSDAFVACFPPAGFVDDWGRQFRGHEAIRGWSDQEFIGVHVTLDVTEVTTGHDDVTITAQVGGDGFNGPSHFTRRPQRNRIHLRHLRPARRGARADRGRAGRLVSATRAPAFWVLADAEGNEACVTTWQGRD